MTDLAEDPSLRQIACEVCRGEGKTWHGNMGGNDPDEYSRTCFACDGDGWIVEEVEPDDECCPGCGACPGFTGVDCDETCEWATVGGGAS